MNEEISEHIKKYNWSGDRDFQLAVIMLRDWVGKGSSSHGVASDQTDGEQPHLVEIVPTNEGYSDVNILHVAGCSGECEFYCYVRDADALPIKEGFDYWATKRDGKWHFEKQTAHKRPRKVKAAH